MTHVVVIGGGGAALRAALAAAERGARVTLVSKGKAGASGCTHAIDSKIEFSVVNWPMLDPDTPSAYADDLERIGRGLKGRERLALFTHRSESELRLLERLGVLLGAGSGYRWIQLAGSSHPRGIVCPPHFGSRVLAALLGAVPRDRLTFMDHTMAVEVLVEGGRATGVVVLDLRRGGFRVIAADAVVLAAGGAGNIFSLSTNPRELVGDGYALAQRAGAVLGHMEFIQYVMLTVAPIHGYFLVTSVLLRGQLVDEGGSRFTRAADAARLGPVEQKRLVAAFMSWIAARKQSAPSMRVFWDATALGADGLAAAMPKTYAAFRRRGHDLARRPVELALGAHQFLGGVVTDLGGRSTVENLFAAGDVADSVHGADRINGSGIMEALVFGALAGAGAAETPAREAQPALPPAYAREAGHGLDRLTGWRRRLQMEMDDVLAVRDRARLATLETRLAGNLEALERGGLAGETPAVTRALHELRSMLTTSLEVVRASLRRAHDIGLFVAR